MGVERAVTRWYVHRQAILDEITQLETELAALSSGSDMAPESAAEASTPSEESGRQALAARVDDNKELYDRLARTQEKLRSLGPCPRSMMG